MQLDRRSLFAAGAAGLLAARLPAEAIPATLAIRAPGRDYRAAIEAIRAYASAELAAVGFPGMVIALTDAEGFAATLSLGQADLATRRPVTDALLFQIGSISKSAAGLWLHAAAAKGRVNLDATIGSILPDVPVPPEPITLRQLLNHVGGTSPMSPVFPRSPGGRLWTGFRPGERFSYSNTGYTLLGLAIARIAGRPHPQVLAEEVLAPIGMEGAVAHILTADRARYATGYVPLRGDLPPLLGKPVVEGGWTELDMAADSIAAPASAMIAYLRYAIALGRGQGGVLMPDAAARALLGGRVEADEFGKGAHYASGFATVDVGGRPVLHHTGGMMLFTSSYHADPVAGVAGFASVNGYLPDYRPRKVTAYAVQAMRAVREGRAIPPAPDPRAFRRAGEPARFAGRWLGPAGAVLDIRQEGQGLVLVADGARGRLEAFGPRMLGTDHPTRATYFLEFEGDKGPFRRLWWGGTPFARDHAPAAPIVPARLRALEGRYVSGDPWTGSAVVIARGDRLAIDGGGEIVERPGGFWSPVEDVGGVDRLWFEAPVAGRPSRINGDGADMLRLD